jgi:antitoxin (DNA-binding transcriptional repressor) of toxin-antitoxin stability system
MITERELCDETAAVLDAVERGETVTITRDGVPTAELGPIGPRVRGANTDELQRVLAGLPPMDYAVMQAEIDEFFDEDDRIREQDHE